MKAPATQAARFRRAAASIVLALAAGVGLAGCLSTDGDLGRPRPTVWTQIWAPQAGFASATARGEHASYFRYTDDEEQMRNRAWRFIMPGHERSTFQGELSNLASFRILPAAAAAGSVSDYFNALTSGAFSSQASRYNRLAEDANADRLLIGPFRANANRVVSMDRVRMRAAEAAPEAVAGKEEAAQARVIENEGLILWVCERVEFRIKSYRYALTNLIVETPSREGVRAERAIMALEAEAGPLCYQMPLNGAFRGGDKRPAIYKG